MSEYVERATCRLCDRRGLEPILMLAPTPPANEFVQEPRPQATYPLWLARCRGCGHVQLPVVIDPEVLFRDYVYVSGTSPSFVRHFQDYAASVGEGLGAQDLVVEIGSNDGTLLRAFRDRYGCRIVGVDPARGIAKRACIDGIFTIPEFFDQRVAQMIERGEGRKAKLAVANNVFAHADDLLSIALAVKELLANDGTFIFEVQYLVDLVEKGLFDMVYHEHLSYHHVAPLTRFFTLLGMTLVDVQRVPTHGGSIRCFVKRGLRPTISTRVVDAVHAEDAALTDDALERFRQRIAQAHIAIRRFLAGERRAGRRVAGYGAPAKLTTLCHHFGIDRRDVEYIFDDSPWKQGLLTPGLHIPVVSAAARPNPMPDTIVIFAWNFADSIAKQLRAVGFHGKIVTPLPELQEIA